MRNVQIEDYLYENTMFEERASLIMKLLPKEVPGLKPLIVKNASDLSAIVVCRREDGEGGIFILKLVKDSQREIQSLEILKGKNFCIDVIYWFVVDSFACYNFGIYLPYYRRTLNDLIYYDATLDAWKAIQQLFTAITYCHSKMIVHRDIKPSNILIDECDNIVLADFGVSETVTANMQLSECIGTFGYMAPEIVLGQGYSFEVDVWSAGVVMYECVVKRQPFGHFDDSQLVKTLYNWETERDSVLDLEGLQPKFCSVVLKTLRSENRPSSARMLEFLKM